MKMLIVLIITTSCASIPEQCDQEYKRYGSLEACIISKENSALRRSIILNDMGRNLRGTSCSSRPDGYGGFYTNCN